MKSSFFTWQISKPDMWNLSFVTYSVFYINRSFTSIRHTELLHYSQDKIGYKVREYKQIFMYPKEAWDILLDWRSKLLKIYKVIVVLPEAQNADFRMKLRSVSFSENMFGPKSSKIHFSVTLSEWHERYVQVTAM